MNDERDPNEESAEWRWSDGRALPTEVYVDSAISQHMGDVFVQLKRGDGVKLGIFVTGEEWEEIDKAARRAIEHRKALTEAGWT